MSVAPLLNTPRAVMQEAGRNAGILAPGQDPNSEQIAEWLKRLNNLKNHWQAKDGLKLWTWENTVLKAPILTAGKNLYQLGPTGDLVMPKPPRVLDAYYQDSNLVNRPLVALSRNEWDTLSVYNVQGAINSYYIDKQVASLNVYLWLTPDSIAATGSVNLLSQNAQNVELQLTDTILLPSEWFLALGWGLSNEICTGQPMAIMMRCKQFADQYYEELSNWDVEDTGTMFQPDNRYQYTGNSFS